MNFPLFGEEYPFKHRRDLKKLCTIMQFIRYVKLHIMIREFAEFSLDATQYSLHSVPIIRSWEDKVGSCLLGG